jgi:signal transduction histidine kinase
VIVGSSAGEQFWVQAAREQLAHFAGTIEIDYLVDASFEGILKTVAALPKDAVVLLGPFLRDGTGRDFATPMVAQRITTASSVPVYALTEGVIGTGVVGGHVMSFDAHGRVAAELALKVLAGERPRPTTAGTTVPMFDDRQLTRRGIDRRLIPVDGIVMFREPSLWERYRGYVIGAVALLLVQSGLIAGLLVQRAQRRRAQHTLAERLRFETLLSNISHALASCPVQAIDREIYAALRRIVEDLETDRATLWVLDDDLGEARVTHSWNRSGIAPMATTNREEQFPWIFSRLRQGAVLRLPLPQSEAAAPELLTDKQSLERISTRSTAVAPLVEGGAVVGALSVGTVVEERHWPDELVPRLRLLADIFANALARQRAERAARESARDIRDLAGRLMTAEEDERRRIARELHDGVNQDLAALSIALSALQDGLPADTPVDRRESFVRLQGRAVELAEAIRQLSHELHPGILQYAGLGAALRSYCREFEREHGLGVECRATDDLGTIPPDVALCLYRVAQEALRNAGRHAKAKRVWVSVERTGTGLALIIRDDGRGFDLSEARSQGGLGLMSLDERVRLAGGRLTIDTEPQRGTKIRVLVPLA